MTDMLSRILYVEDEPDIQLVAKLALEMLSGFTLAVCSSGSEALERICPFNPQFILLDMMMPGMDGLTTMARIREILEYVNTPVVFMTAKVQSTEVVAYKELGALDVIPKPF
jgi:CheY-like chemotaxis protein